MLVAPATSNIIAKIAHGLCDDQVSLMVAAAACPVIFAPAMNNRMWSNPIAQENVAKLTKHGYRFIGPEDGWLACRNVGPGRLSEPQTIVDEISKIVLKSPKVPSSS
jgi:phosphopantothenoylcysteine decarboxylase/phosphopantothenate--cysteine ligase